jgi:hypothetical protein
VAQEALATEDMGFYKHKGFKIGLMRRALGMNLDKGWYVYGGSTISQQLVKNLYLSREKTLARKLEEAVIVWAMERTIDKDRILELYLNCIEFGKHIFGIKAAAEAYFNKEPKDLTALEGAFLMATKPSPRYAWTVYKKRSFNEWWVLRMDGILKRLWVEMSVIDEDAYTSDAPYLPTFWYPEDGVYARPAVGSSTAAPPGMPTELPKDPKLPPAAAPDAPDGPGAAPEPPAREAERHPAIERVRDEAPAAEPEPPSALPKPARIEPAKPEPPAPRPAREPSEPAAPAGGPALPPPPAL